MPNPSFKNFKKIVFSDNLLRFSVVRKVLYTFLHHKITISYIIALTLGACSLLFAEDRPADLFFGRSGTISSTKTKETRESSSIGKEIVPAKREKRKKRSPKEEDLTSLQEQARIYRYQGLEAQNRGDLETAFTNYQKAVELDPSFEVAYNDLGVLYEASGAIERAEESYLKAIIIDPYYLSAYTNLALLYENKRDLKNAALYWKKRAQLGGPDDTWTIKAKARYGDICLSLGEARVDTKEQEVMDLVKDVSAKKKLSKKNNKALAKAVIPVKDDSAKKKLTEKNNKVLAKDYFEKAKCSLGKGDLEIAYKQALNAWQLDPSIDSMKEFIEQLQTRLLSR